MEYQKIFYTEDCPAGVPLKGDMFYRSMELGTFIKEAEEAGHKVVGIKFDESNNCELIIEVE